MKITIDIAMFLQIASALAVLVGALTWLLRSARRIGALLRRVEELERRAEHRKKDTEMTLKGVVACLEGLKEQGCNGKVTGALSELNRYIVESR